jgi:hypothetical protein
VTSVAPDHWPAPELPDGAPPPAARDGADAWPAWIAPIGLVTGLIGSFVGGILVFLVAEGFGVETSGDAPPGVLIGGTIALHISLIGAAVIFARLTGRVSADQFGLRATGLWRAVGGMVLAYIAFVVLAAVWIAIVGEPDDEPLLDDLGVDESTALLVLGIATVCVAAPLVEEFFFRGFFYRALRNRAGVAGAAVATGVVFGLIHAASSPPENLVPLAILGALFCLLYQWTGSIYPCIALHAINNAIAFGVDQDFGGWIVPLAAGAVTVSLLIAMAAARLWRPATR